MNKKIERFAAEHGLTCNKNDMSGVYNGYQISIHWCGNLMMSNMFYVGFHVNFGEKTSEVLNWLSITQKKALKISQVSIDGSGVYCIFPAFTLGGSLKRAHETLYCVTEYLKSLGIDGALCPYCGGQMEEGKLVEDNYCRFRAHEECFNAKFAQVESAEAAEQNRPNNYLRGFFGALLGGLVGMLLFWGLFQIGFVAAISSLLGALLGSFLYSKFGGKNNKVKVVIVAAVVFVLTAAAFFLCYLQVVREAMSESGLYGSAIEMLSYLLEVDEEIRVAFWSDCVLSVLFAGLGVFFVILIMVRQQKKISSGMKKHD